MKVGKRPKLFETKPIIIHLRLNCAFLPTTNSQISWQLQDYGSHTLKYKFVLYSVGCDDIILEKKRRKERLSLLETGCFYQLYLKRSPQRPLNVLAHVNMCLHYSQLPQNCYHWEESLSQSENRGLKQRKLVWSHCMCSSSELTEIALSESKQGSPFIKKRKKERNQPTNAYSPAV